ncbi:MAG: hypothetical protein HON43_00395 [Alphaproteobacteria bacterium]|jgi:hypothetical protein|nr:hypothetical protein [Alphaproteobacteria bacterium]MBT5389471.1 hypothetical protein [Alphaproteobacteria bacterium]
MRDITLGKIISILSFFTLAQICHSMPPGPEEVFSQEDFQKSTFEKVHVLRQLLLSKSFTIPDKSGAGSSNIQKTEDKKKAPNEGNEDYWQDQCERGVKRILNIRKARRELINFEVGNEKAWEDFYSSLQSLKGNLSDEDVLFRWPTQDSFEHACKAHLLLRAVLGDEQLLSYLEFTVFNTYQDAALIKTVFENLFWENPRLLERGHLETLRVSGDNKCGKEASQYETVYGNSMAHWLYFSWKYSKEYEKRTLREKIKILRINIGTTSFTAIKPLEAQKHWERFKFLTNPNFVSEQETFWRVQGKDTLERKLEEESLHAGIALGCKIAPPARDLSELEDEVFLEAVNFFVKAGRNGNPKGWFWAYSYNSRLVNHFRGDNEAELYRERETPYRRILYLNEGGKLRSFRKEEALVNAALFKENGIDISI